MLTWTQYALVYLISVPIFFAIDMVWLVVVAKTFYRSHLGSLLSDTVIWPVAISFYLLFLLGLLIFAIAPAIEARDVYRALLMGALFGFFTYATYDLTNWSTLANWPWQVALVDMAWGTVLSASVAFGTYRLAMLFM